MAKTKVGVFSANVARRIYLNAGGGKTAEVDQFGKLEKISRGIWCVPTATIPKRSSSTVIGSTVADGIDCDVVELISGVVTATGKKLKVKNASKSTDIPSGVLICPFITNWGWCAIWEDC